MNTIESLSTRLQSMATNHAANSARLMQESIEGMAPDAGQLATMAGDARMIAALSAQVLALANRGNVATLAPEIDPRQLELPFDRIDEAVEWRGLVEAA